MHRRMSTAVASLLALGAAVLCVPELHRWMEGVIIVQVENDSERSVLHLEVVLPGDSVIIDSVSRGGTASLRLRPQGDGALLFRSSSFADDTLLIPIYVDRRYLPGEGRVIVQLLPDNSYLVRRQSHDGPPLRPRVRP